MRRCVLNGNEREGGVERRKGDEGLIMVHEKVDKRVTRKLLLVRCIICEAET